MKGFTEALRMEVENDGLPVSVTLVKPGQIDTPFTVNAKNYLASEPHHVPPIYAPEVVARAILHAAEQPIRDIFAGGGARVMAAAEHMAPGLTDKLMEATVIPGTPSGKPPRRPRDGSGLDRPPESLQERGNYEGHVMTTSAYTEAALRPWLTSAAIVSAGLALAALLRGAPTGQCISVDGAAARKALHIRLEAKPGREAEVENLMLDILDFVRREPATRPWYGLRRNHSVFEIFETFPNEAGQVAHLSGRGAMLLIKRSNALLARPAMISRLDVLASKPG